MPTDLKDPEKSQEDIASAFNNIIDNSLSDLKGLGSNREGDDSSQSMSRRQRRKAARSEVKQNKKDNIGKKDQKAKGENDPLNQKHQTDKNIGHIPGLGKLTKAARQGKRGERMDAAKTMAKRYAMKKLRKAVVKKLKQKIAQAALSNPYVLGAIAIFLFIVLLIVSLGANEELYADPNDPALIPLLLSKTGPDTARIGDELIYQIAVGYAGTAEDITIVDTIPEGTEYIDSTPPAKYDDATRIATWNLRDHQVPQGPILNNVDMKLSIKLKIIADNIFLINQASGSVTGAGTPPGGGGLPTEGYVPPAPESNDCGGKYDFSKWADQNAIGNFGDPLCSFSKDNLYNLLKSKEANQAYVDIWFNVIIPGEAVGWSPNTHAPPSSGTPDAGGAWGLYQMGSSTPLGVAPPSPGKNGEFDRGDVNWEVQTTNALSHWQKSNCNFWSYWEAYRKAGLPNVDRC